jgi:hypothetical protein
MPAGFDARIGIAKETTYGTRVAPARFLPLTAEDLGFNVGRYFSPAIGTGMWGHPSVVTTKVGSGSISGDVPTVGFSYLVDGLHGNTVTPVQQAATTAYLHTHTLNSPPSKSYSVQVQTPPVTSTTLVPHDMTGVMWGGLTLSWSAAGVLSFSFPAVYQNLDTAQTLATYTAPSAYSLFGFQGGSLSFGGSAETNIIGDGSLTIAYPMRDDAFKLGTAGLIAKPVITDKPTATLSTTADFEDNVDLLRGLKGSSTTAAGIPCSATATAGIRRPACMPLSGPSLITLHGLSVTLPVALSA